MGFFAKKITDYQSDKMTFAKRLRQKRIQPFLRMIEAVYEVKGSVSILDIGGTTQYWKIIDENLLRKFKVTITLINLPSAKVLSDTEFTQHIDGDATSNLWEKFEMSSFDLIHSNSVIEHVGDWRKMKAFAHNIESFIGGYYVQTPNYWFPIEPHCMTLFFHWLPKPLRVALVARKSLGHWAKAATVSEAVDKVESARLLDKRMFSELFNDAEISSEKLFFLTKSLVAIRK